MRTAKPGDRVQVHYVIHAQHGGVASSRCRAPLELTVGIDHPRLPGLGLTLVGLVPGTLARLRVPAERAFGVPDPARVQRWPRQRFPANAALEVGTWVRLTDEAGRRRLVRVLEVDEKMVLVDANHRLAGQALVLEVRLLAINGPVPDAESRAPRRVSRVDADVPARSAEDPIAAVRCADAPMARNSRAIAFDVDRASLATLEDVLPLLKITAIYGATVASLPCDWNPGKVDLFILGVRADAGETLGLCRFLDGGSSSAPSIREGGGDTHGSTPLLVLVRVGQELFIKEALEAGAHSCLILPINAKEVASMLVHARTGNQPGRHTLNLEGAQREDRWRDEGGEG